jgi:hypothetical protein
MMQADEVVVKADVLGRVRTSRERWEQLLDEFERSGLTGQKFAAVVFRSGGSVSCGKPSLTLPDGAFSNAPMQSSQGTDCQAQVWRVRARLVFVSLRHLSELENPAMGEELGIEICLASGGMLPPFQHPMRWENLFLQLPLWRTTN